MWNVKKKKKHNTKKNVTAWINDSPARTNLSLSKIFIYASGLIIKLHLKKNKKNSMMSMMSLFQETWLNALFFFFNISSVKKTYYVAPVG